MSLVERVLAGDRLALAQALSMIENEDPSGEDVLANLFPHGGHAHLVGVTGGTGTGKSTLVNALARSLRAGGLPALTEGAAPRPVRVAIVAVDPSSPFSGGAILGDRIRMADLAGDPEVFIRSMATRGALGGLAARTRPVVQALDAAGFDFVFIETVGAGQTEVEIARTAHTTIVVEAPGLGDDVQALKAGILEIADILVVNKADLEGARRSLAALRSALRLRPGNDGEGWQVPLLQTVATEGEGISKLAAAIARHRAYLDNSGRRSAIERNRIEAELIQLLRDRLLQRFRKERGNDPFERMVKRVQDRELSPGQAVEGLLKRVE